ncbi:MAG: ABC transporter ATP-binding protein [Tissierellia bacterium]|nr:ABC transporter ATP-binding protein [Tissierellia bacterium]
MFKNFRWFISNYKVKYIIGLTFLLLSDIVGLIPPYITGKLTDKIFSGIALKPFLWILALDLLVIGIKYIFAITWSYFTFQGASQIEYESRERLIHKFLKQSLRFYEKNSTGSLMSKATNDVSVISEFAGYGTLSFFDSTIFPLCIVIVMILVVDLKLTLVSILPLPLLAYLCIRIGDKIYEKFAIAQRAFDKLNDTALEDIEGIRIIRVFNLQKPRFKTFEERGQNLCDKNLEVVKYEALMTPVQRIIPAITFVIAIGYGTYLITKGEITVGQLLSFTYYLNMLVWPMYALGNFINLKQQANASMERIWHIWNYKEEIVENPKAKPIENPGDILFKDHSFTYPTSKVKNLKNINLEIPQGTSLGVLGRTGSGKTTLLKQLLRVYPMDTQSIYIGDQSMEDTRIYSLRDQFGYAPQDHMIFSKTIEENITLSKPEATKEEVLHALELADLKKDIDIFPQGLQTLCGERGLSLSGGQKQRIAIARAMIKDPNILILDDAMSAVDGATEKNIIDNIYRERKGKTTIIACHRISQVKDCDHIIVLKDGEIVESGNHHSLMKENGWYAEQYRNQMGRRKFDES